MSVPTPEATDQPMAALAFLKLLADDTRWRLIQGLRHSDRQAGELASLCQLPNNLVSYHLNLLRQGGLVQLHRSDADARVLYYALNTEAFQQGFQQVGNTLPVLAQTPVNILPATVIFLCTHNSARSQMAEGWLRYLSGGAVIARSAGIAPTILNPIAAEVMAEVGVDIAYQQAKGIESLAAHPDVIITVCDLAREQCPPAFQHVPFLHWSIPDPTRVARDEAQRYPAFRAARDQLRTRIQGLLSDLNDLRQTASA